MFQVPKVCQSELHVFPYHVALSPSLSRRGLVFVLHQVIWDSQHLTEFAVERVKVCSITELGDSTKVPIQQPFCAEPGWKWARSHFKSASGWFGKEVLAMPAKELSSR